MHRTEIQKFQHCPGQPAKGVKKQKTIVNVMVRRVASERFGICHPVYQELSDESQLSVRRSSSGCGTSYGYTLEHVVPKWNTTTAQKYTAP